MAQKPIPRNADRWVSRFLMPKSLVSLIGVSVRSALAMRYPLRACRARPSALRTAARNYQRALDRLIQEAAFAA